MKSTKDNGVCLYNNKTVCVKFTKPISNIKFYL